MNKYCRVDWDNYGELLVSRGVGTVTDFNLLKDFAKGSILDVGCGTGYHLALLNHPKVDFRLGVDRGMPGLIYAKQHYPDIRVVLSTVYNLPFKENRFDLVYAIDVVEHLGNPLAALAECYRVCKKGGIFFVQTPNYPIKHLYDFLHWAKRSRDTWQDDPTHVTKLNFRKLILALKQANFTIERAIASNILLQNYSPYLKKMRDTIFGRLFGHKVIVVARK